MEEVFIWTVQRRIVSILIETWLVKPARIQLWIATAMDDQAMKSILTYICNPSYRRSRFK